jgi:uncharacterized membrane protein (UPF0127 family)
MSLFARVVRLLALSLLLAFAGFPAAAQDGPQPKLKVESLEILTKAGIRVFNVEMAETPEQQRVGLMFRKEVPDGEGMLFDFRVSRPVAMWMQNTIASLDMIFIRADGTIANIAKRTTPYSLATVESLGPVKAVLEVAAGAADRYGIAAGDKVSHRIFGGR